MKLTEEKRQELLKLPTGNVADSVGRDAVMNSAIKPVDTSFRLIGRAFTARCTPGDNLGIHQAIYAAQPGDVLVIDVRGYSEAGHLGDIMATACKVRGLAGVVIDGSVRDSQDIRELGFPVFARAFNPSGTTKNSPAQLNEVISCGGVSVHPGDIVFGDCDGVVVVPQEREDEVFAKALAKFDKENAVRSQLEAGKTTLEIYGFDRLLENR